MQKKNNDVKQKNYRPDEVLTKCHLREDYNPKSLVGYNEIKVSVLVHLWKGGNVEQPVFIKLMRMSHASHGFLLSIPVPFCRRYLPAVDTLITLETKSGDLYETKYLPRRAGLSGGWKRFAIDQKLVEGDLAIFHLVEATIFKVYIIRQGSSTVKLPTPLLNLYTEARQCVVDDSQLVANNRRKVRHSEDNSNCTIMRMNIHNGEEKNFRLDEVTQVLRKCRFREDYKHKNNSLLNCNAIKLSFVVNVWNKENLEQPIFTRFMLRGHTSIGFHLGIPSSFSRRYLPVEDTIMTLETESGDLYKAKYLPRKLGLSAGWVRFANAEKLLLGDLVVFHLVEPTKFKVYITRQDSSTIRLPTPLLNLYKEARQCDRDDSQLIVYNRRKVHQSEEHKNWKDTYQVDIDFSNIKGFKDFNTVLSGSLENQHLSESLTHDYYELCHAHNAFLHAHLCKGLNPELSDIKSSISETVSIGIALRACTLSTFLDKFSEWTKILTYYGAIGMDVSLLSARLDHLRNLAESSDGAVSRSRYIKACGERVHTECEIKKLEMVLAKWRKFYIKLGSMVKDLESKSGWEKYMEAYFRLTQAKDEIREIEALIADFAEFFEHYDAVIETLKLKAINHEHQFQKEAAAPW